MEVLCLSNDRASLSIPEQEKQTRMLFQYFQAHRLEPEHTFHFDVPYNAVAATLAGLVLIIHINTMCLLSSG